MKVVKRLSLTTASALLQSAVQGAPHRTLTESVGRQRRPIGAARRSDHSDSQSSSSICAGTARLAATRPAIYIQQCLTISPAPNTPAVQTSACAVVVSVCVKHLCQRPVNACTPTEQQVCVQYATQCLCLCTMRSGLYVGALIDSKATLYLTSCFEN